jgi:hypothetical protein
MRPWLAPLLAAATLASAGCGADHPPLSLLCTSSERPIARALERAPGAVALSDGTRLSDCVSRAREPGDLQNFGVVVVRVADRLADRARRRERGVAVQLGYLIGAAERGAAHSNGINAELVHRLQITSRRVPPAAQDDLERGRRAGRRTG